MHHADRRCMGAEEGVRLQSRLMVISLNCQHLFLSHGQNMYQQYRAFEARHRGLFGEYEDVLIRAGGRDITALRTQESNDVSLRLRVCVRIFSV